MAIFHIKIENKCFRILKILFFSKLKKKYNITTLLPLILMPSSYIYKGSKNQFLIHRIESTFRSDNFHLTKIKGYYKKR